MRQNELAALQRLRGAKLRLVSSRAAPTAPPAPAEPGASGQAGHTGQFGLTRGEGPVERAQQERRPYLSFYVVYERPADYPEEYVVRRWDTLLGPAEDLHVRSRDLAVIHQFLLEDMKLHRMPPSSTDDPVILEVWV